jgi:DNA-binding transcriptional MerR regulator
MDKPRFTIEELSLLLERALDAATYDGQSSGRVRAVPDLRTIRYYTTLGLLAPPAEMRGRKAYYDRRHLLQLVAIKRLQSRGMTLGQIQQSLAGADDRALARWAEIPEDFWDRAVEALPRDAEKPSPEASRGATRSRESFWAAAPSMTAQTEAPPQTQPQAPLTPSAAVCLSFAKGADLILKGVDPGQIDQAALARLSPALESLTQVLRDLGLITPTEPDASPLQSRHPFPPDRRK